MDTTNIIQPKDINNDTLNYIHDNGVNFLKETVTSLAVIKKNAVLLLSYLIIVVTFLIGKLFSLIIDVFNAHNTTMPWSYIIPLVIVAVYYLWITLSVIKISLPIEGNSPYFAPLPYMNKDYYLEDEAFKQLNCDLFHYFKYQRCLQIQDDIDNNLKLLQQRHSAFKKALNKTLLIPILRNLVISSPVAWLDQRYRK